MESMQHLFYVTAITRTKENHEGHAWADFTPFQFLSMGYVSLNFIWLKVIYQRKLYIDFFSKDKLKLILLFDVSCTIATHYLEIFPTLGTRRWHSIPRKYGTLHDQ